MTKFFRLIRYIYGSILNLFAFQFGAFAASRNLVIEEGKVLAVDQGKYLELPGGGVKFGETFAEAAEREAEEETGLDVEVEQIIAESNFGSHSEVLFKSTTEEHDLEGSWGGKPVWIDTEKVDSRNWRYNRDISNLIMKCED